MTAGEPTENNSRNKRAVNTDVISSVPGPSSARSKVAPDEYRYDSSDEEVILTIMSTGVDLPIFAL